MNEFFRQVQTDLKRIWSQMSLNQRVLLGAVSVAALGLLTFLIIWAQTPTYGVLFSKLSDQDASSIVAKLKEQNIPYQLEGTAIKVPEGQVHEARLRLAGEGLPAGGTVGFQELFNGSNWAATDFERRLNYQRGLEGELARTIASIEGVDSARVHIVLPKESLFIDNQEETTASVVLTLNPGSHLELPQIKTIQHFVAKAVPHLAENQVFVTDTSGRDYSEEIAKLDPKNLAGTDLSSRQLDIKKKYEKDLTRKIQGQLDTTLGPDNSTVSINTVWDFSQTEENAELYKPSQGLPAGIPLSEKRLREEYNGNVGQNGGVPGTVSNVAPSYQGATGQDGRYRKEESTINYNNDKTVTRRIKEPAVLRDTTIAISFNPPSDLTGAALDRQAREIAQLAAMAAGIPMEQLATKVVVTPIRFNTAAADAAREAAATAERNAALLKWGTVLGALALAAVTFGLLYASFRRRQRQAELEAAEEELVPVADGGLGITLLGEEGLTSVIPKEEASPEQLRLDEMKRELAAYVKSQPKEAVKLVKTWMIEDE